MTEYELEAAYGPYLAQVRLVLGEAGIRRLLEAHSRGTEVHSDQDAPNADRVAGLMMTAAGDTTLESLATEMRKHEATYQRAWNLLMGGVLAEAIVNGTPETEISRRTGISRTAIRRHLGKAKR